MRLILLALTLLSGCITYDPTKPIPVVDEGPQWMSTAFDQTIAFWHTHNIDVQRADHGIHLIVGLRYNPTEPKPAPGMVQAGQYWYDDSTIHLGEWLESESQSKQAGCIIAHEIGHAIAMGGFNVHTSPGSLMTYGNVMTGDHCSWSDKDQAALDRLLKQQ